MASYGSVYLAGIQLDVDPSSYQIIGGHRHGSMHHLVGGTTIFQDRGFDVTHARITLSGELFNYSTVTALANLYRSSSAIQMSFTDWNGNALTVLFVPGDDAFTVDTIHGATSGWTYNLHLAVIAATNWNGIINPA